MKTAISLYLSWKIFYQVLREYLHLPHPNTIKSHFGILNTPGNVTDCWNTIVTAFRNFSGKEKYSKLLVDEIWVKPVVRYQGTHIIGFSHDEPTKAAKSVLDIIIVPMMGAPCICLSTNFSIFSKAWYFLRANTKIYHCYSSKRRLYLSSDG